MRPVRRGASPQSADFDPYGAAKVELVSRLGGYCSYCERPVSTSLAVEHVQPKKGPHGHPDLVGRWENFLLVCVNCNSTKGDRRVVLQELLLPDRDNTFAAYDYPKDGTVRVATGLAGSICAMAATTLSLVGLDKPASGVTDSNGKEVAIDRVSQRKQAWLSALESKDLVQADPTNNALRRMTVRLAMATGFFSIWMNVFRAETDMRGRLLEAFEGTLQSGCFDAKTTQPVVPAPNPDRLPHGSKA